MENTQRTDGLPTGCASGYKNGEYSKNLSWLWSSGAPVSHNRSLRARELGDIVVITEERRARLSSKRV